MLRPIFLTLATAAAMAVVSGAQAQEPALNGVWRNPKDSVHVDLRPCGAGLCGYVVWASPKAQADAHKAGTESLVGSQLLRDFSQEKSGVWRGRVFVPDLNATFRGTAELIDGKSMRAKGCLIANMLCKSQIWTRVEIPAG